ncbi:Tn3 family transposase [Streptomyces sp. NPDC102278]|uniref:Tn3 family transposase n=1 Tax=Streptomyces sp. NPDC102278 TaxID=3366152 RepID=UPI00381E8EB1
MTPSKQSKYVRIDALFGEPGKNTIDFDLIESQFRHLMRVAVSVREGRVIRTVQLLRYLSDASIRRRVTATANKVESFNRFAQWIGFGNRSVIADRHARGAGAPKSSSQPPTRPRTSGSGASAADVACLRSGSTDNGKPWRWDIGVGRPCAHDVEWP